MKLLRGLTDCFGVSGCEQDVAMYIRKELENKELDIHQDLIGNVIAKKNNDIAFKTIMLCAHMDEVGFIITSINDTGLLCFDTIGGINIEMLPGKKVYVGDSRIEGIITCFTRELTSENKFSAINDLYIDIGVLNRIEAMQLIKIGDYSTFQNSFSYLGDKHIRAKALDDRIGCSLIIELLKEQFRINFIGCFTVQEEIGLRGARLLEDSIHSDICIILDCVPSLSFPNTKEDEIDSTLGCGPVFTIIDERAVYDRSTIVEFINIANKYNIPFQIKKSISGSTDGAAIKFGSKANRVVIISIPCKFIHSSSTLINLDDIRNTYLLIYYFLKNFELSEENLC